MTDTATTQIPPYASPVNILAEAVRAWRHGNISDADLIEQVDVFEDQLPHPTREAWDQ